MSKYSKAQYCLALLIPALFIAFCLASMDVDAAGTDEIVMFNTKSYKYHCPSCRWAKKCTRNCISIKKVKRSNAAGSLARSVGALVSRKRKQMA